MRTRLGAGLGHAVSAQPHPVARFDQGNHPPATRAGGTHDPIRAGLQERVDQPQHRRDGRVRAGPGEQFWSLGQRPCQPAALPGLGCGGVDRGGHGSGVDAGIDRGGDLQQDLHRVVLGRRAAMAECSSYPVPAGDPSGVPAVRARLGPGAAYPAVPVLPATLQGAQRFAAVGADRRRDTHSTGVAQRGQQITDHPRCRRATVQEHRWVVGQGLGQSTSFGPPSCDALCDVTDRRPIKPVFHVTDKVDDHREGR